MPAHPTGKLMIGNLLRGGAFWLGVKVAFERSIQAAISGRYVAGILEVTF
jgi:hypothetical protein